MTGTTGDFATGPAPGKYVVKRERIDFPLEEGKPSISWLHKVWDSGHEDFYSLTEPLRNPRAPLTPEQWALEAHRAHEIGENSDISVLPNEGEPDAS